MTSSPPSCNSPALELTVRRSRRHCLLALAGAVLATLAAAQLWWEGQLPALALLGLLAPSSLWRLGRQPRVGWVLCNTPRWHWRLPDGRKLPLADAPEGVCLPRLVQLRWRLDRRWQSMCLFEDSAAPPQLRRLRQQLLRA